MVKRRLQTATFQLNRVSFPLLGANHKQANLIDRQSAFYIDGVHSRAFCS